MQIGKQILVAVSRKAENRLSTFMMSVIDLSKWCSMHWPEMFSEVLLCLGDRLEVAIDKTQDAHAEEAEDAEPHTKKRRGLEVQAADVDLSSERGQLGFLHATSTAMQNTFFHQDCLSTCCDFGRTGGKHRMISLFALPSNECQWAPPQDQFANTTLHDATNI